MAVLLIGINSDAFACDKCAGETAKTSAQTALAKTTKPVAKTLASAKIAPKTKVAAPIATKKAATKTGAKWVSLPVKSVAVAKVEAPMCPMCAAEAAKK